MDYKDSLLLPKTDFPMRGSLPQNEPLRYKKWDEENVYEKMKENRVGCESFTLHDGPPYANGNIHIGHALNKILKDIINKFHYFDGKSIRYTPGWDCHGLPIEQKVEEKIGSEKKKTIAKSKLRELCREHATKFVDIQKAEFKSLGVIADWENPYLTMDFRFEANIYRELCAIAKQGLLVQRSKPVYWSWAAQTALAEAEVEYEDKTSPSIYVAFKLQNMDASVIIWTTTPWTLPANQAIALNKDEEYVLTSDKFIVARKLYNSLIEQEVIKGEVVETIDVLKLENTNATNPLNGRDSRVIFGEHVLMDSGSGAVHTAPGHGEDDYKVSLKYGIEVIMPVDAYGKYDETIVREKLFKDSDKYLGLNVFKANDLILEELGEALLKKQDIRHSYPHCWRTHTPIIFRATKQWFISIDDKYGEKNQTLRENAMKVVENLKFYPEWGRNRLKAMLEGRPDWCISRQRDWGVPIAFFRNKKTDEIVFDEKVLNYTAMIFEKFGCDAWYDMEIKDLLNPASGLNPDDLEKTLDILDVWFDSGSTQNAVLRSGNYDAGTFPADMYLEGSDQHRGWFQSSLLTTLASSEVAPYKSILTHGFTVDEKGEKMSKSKGNVVAPDKVLKEYGSEILRVWVAMSDYQSDLKISDNILKQNAELYRKIRNTARFLLANIDGLEKIVEVEKMGVLDKWILSKAKRVFDDIESSFKVYEFSKGLNRLNNFLVADLSGIYLDVCKDRLYCDSKDDIHRVASQSAMAIITKKLIGTLACILTYTMDELLEFAPSIIKEDAKNIFDFKKFELPKIELTVDEELFIEAKEKFSEIKDSLSKEKIIKSTLELEISTNSEEFLALDEVESSDWFLVSKISNVSSTTSNSEILGSFKIDEKEFKIFKSSGYKCPRCWKFTSKNEESLCSRCEEVVK
ncbi:isoleucine--tRNA ligase [Aliarcobacter trophiarum LMG 25534]|uniref:Isoleucine--tRNA ligase n=1 Tax=Aliarcobacter trophiarum LMG 25534 TaxID=1032241 RepID=A0AAD0QK43_9BACT|nr:isoleucine--tRNA ligase [Aliarcobacter trophiarum]AXK49327.1 isoleucyl-tRNA synthetase [Aliarcobacter trophiarum LMG 25534]RXI27725.1 isoleucine--tRNA ligase [Aliarcobacter trophiarum]RXJ90107.1 isoleucine--tRNA ligase [Aliarcobacter trophiarum LMG 25534]